MAFLKLLESLRTPAGEWLAGVITLLGEETFFHRSGAHYCLVLQ